MTSGIDTLHPSAHTFGPAAASPDLYAQMEDINARVEDYLNTLGQNPPSQMAPALSPELEQEAFDTVNEIRMATGQEPITGQNFVRRLHELLQRVAEIAEQHIQRTQEENHEKKENVRSKNVENIRYLTRSQANAHFASGIFSPVLLVAAGVVGGETGKLLGTAAQSLPSAFSNAASQYRESQKQVDQFELNLYLNKAATENTKLEGLKNLSPQLQQLLTKLIDIQMRAVQSTGQR